MTLETTLTALLTLAIYSFLAGDSPIYKFVEHLLIGLTLGYSLVLTVRTVIIPQAVEPLAQGQLSTVIPLMLGGTMLLRLSRRSSGWSQIALALVIGVGAGASIPAMMQARVLKQIASTVSGSASINGAIILAGVAATLSYFVFSRPQTGLWGRVTILGRWFMMIFFGATFAYTVMSRLALLIGRLEFLLGDWLRLL